MAELRFKISSDEHNVDNIRALVNYVFGINGNGFTVTEEPPDAELKTWRITQITYQGSGRRHTENWQVQTRREPMEVEVRELWRIPVEDAILVCPAPPIQIWDLP